MSHQYENMEENANIWINMRKHPLKPSDPAGSEFVLVRRPNACVSVFDSGFLLGDGVWEGIRLHNRRTRTGALIVQSL